MSVILITGSGRGIGAATARLLAQRGHAVAVNYLRRRDSAEQLVAQIVAGGGRAIAVQADTASAADVQRLFDTVDAEFGVLGGLVNNAGITGRAGPLASYDEVAMRRILDVNVVGAMLCAQQAVKRMSTQHGGAGGSIVNVSSIAAVLGGAGNWIPYAAAKGALNTITVGLSREVAAQGIRVNAVMPGLIDTEIHAEAGVADRLQKVIAMVPMGRIGTPAECAEAIAWLLSGEAAYMTGAVLPMTGGR
jgi:NAD(P)-dependent dehydrogenase (short-subunit alcohol dehydrogenase family)